MAGFSARECPKNGQRNSRPLACKHGRMIALFYRISRQSVSGKHGCQKETDGQPNRVRMFHNIHQNPAFLKQVYSILVVVSFSLRSLFFALRFCKRERLLYDRA